MVDGTALAPVRQQSMRRHNLALVMRYVAEHGPVSRAQIATASGLTKATVSALIDELIKSGLTAELGAQLRAHTGRPSRPLALNPDGPVGIGLEINVDYVAIAVQNLAGEIRMQKVCRGDSRGSDPDVVLGRATSLTQEAFAAADEHGWDVLGLAVAVPGLTDPERGLLRRAPNLGWSDVPVVDTLRRLLGRPDLQIHVDNEANLAALGELWFGGGREWGDFVHVSGEIGVGAGLVVGGQLFRGAHGFAGELGHVAVQPRGPRCACGARGCLEQVSGQEAILRAAGLSTAAATAIGQPEGSIAELVARAQRGEANAGRAIREAGKYLGIAVSSLVNVVDPATVVLGGLYATLAPWLREPVERQLRERAIANPWSKVTVEVSRLAGEAAVRGAAGVVVQRVIANPGLRPPTY
ncbi:ROK family transcriptional regulator [Streptomyces sp. KR80]|uniref:ROK family transcriptional regulator n=1 Tax=Streptomyces sp. KR80 TaxID=3457426 RepID=UPI003FD67698